MKKTILLLFALALFVGCSIQKRKYQNGFYVTWKHNKTSEKTKEAEQKSGILESQITTAELPQHQVKFLSADVNSKTLVLSSVQTNYLLLNDTCDEIVFKDGREVKAKIMEISLDQIKYKRCNMSDGPTYVAKKSEIFMVKYANGTNEVFKNEAVVPSSNNNTNKNSPPSLPSQQKTNPLAIISLVFGILGVYPLTGLGSIVALVCGIVARKQIRNSPDKYKGNGMATAGIWLGIIMLLLILFVLLILLAVLMSI